MNQAKLLKGKETTYVLENQIIGEGRYGIVYQAYNKANPNEKYAVKVLLANKDIGAKDNKDVDREFEILGLLNNENVMKLFEIVKEESIFLVLELCESNLEKEMEKVDYKKILSNGKFETNHKTKMKMYMRQLISGFREIHKKSAIHRDIKPSNILISKGNIKIADFGFSRLIGQLNIPQLLTNDKMTPLWGSLELLRGEKYSDKCDVYSCGVVIYQLFFGEHPYLPKSILPKVTIANLPQFIEDAR